MTLAPAPHPNTAEAAEKVRAIAARHGLTDFLASVDAEAAGATLTIALLGEFNAGKSTLANALLGQALLPTMAKPTTAAVVELAAGCQLAARVEGVSGWRDISIAEVGHYASGPGADEIKRMVLEVPANPFIREGVRLVDTPGISSIHETHADITHGYLAYVDAALVVLDINKGGATAALKQFITEKVTDPKVRERIYIVLNYADTKADDAVAATIAETRAQLADVLPGVRIFAVSARQAEQGERDRSGIAQVEAAIQEIVARKQAIVAERRAKLVAARARDLVGLLRVQHDALDADTSELDAKIAEFQRGKGDIERERQALQAAFERCRDACVQAGAAVSNRYADRILAAAFEPGGRRLDAEAQALSKELVCEIEGAVAQLKGAVNIKADHLTADVSRKVEEAAGGIRDLIDVISPILTGVAIAAVTGPVGLAAGEAAQAAGAMVLAKTAAKDFMQKLDVPGLVMKWGAKAWKREEVAQHLSQAINSRITRLLADVEAATDQTLQERIAKPLAELERSLIEARQARTQSMDKVADAKAQLRRDQAELEQLAR